MRDFIVNGGTPSLLSTARRRRYIPTAGRRRYIPTAGRRAAHPRPQSGHGSAPPWPRRRDDGWHTVFCIHYPFLFPAMHYIEAAVCRELT